MVSPITHGALNFDRSRKYKNRGMEIGKTPIKNDNRTEWNPIYDVDRTKWRLLVINPFTPRSNL